MDSDPDIISIDSIQRKGVLYRLAFSNGFEIRATKGVIERLKLVEGAQFTQQTFEELRKVLEERFAFYTAESLLARRPYSIGEFKQRMGRKEISEGLISRIVKEFRGKGILDDYKYALARVKSLIDRKPAGKGYLVGWLQQRLVPREIAQEAVAEALGNVDEVATAVDLLERKRSSFEKFDLETARHKAYTYLSRRAISYGAAKTAFSKVFGKTTD